MLKKFRNYVGGFRLYNKERKQVVQLAKTYKQNRLAARIIRYVHSIEKGLSIENPRPEFGYDKIKTLYAWIKEYLNIKNINKMPIYMAADALSAYCDYHDKIGVATEKIIEIRAISKELKKIKESDGVEGVFGGVLKVFKNEISFDVDSIEKLFKTRHSIRQFEKTPVSMELIYKAIELAQTAPSACNRQAVRAYVIDAEKFIKSYGAKLQGVGGFADDCDKFILLTGQISAYEDYEYKQFVVSTGIFAGYLSLALHGLGVGACVVQRSLRPDVIWEEFCKVNDIPLDEQLVCMLTVGNLKEETVVPLSKRYETDIILKKL